MDIKPLHFQSNVFVFFSSSSQKLIFHFTIFINSSALIQNGRFHTSIIFALGGNISEGYKPHQYMNIANDSPRYRGEGGGGEAS